MQKPFSAAATPLIGPFDTRRLPHGLYVAESASPAYPLLKAMTIAKQASVVGETNIAPGVRALTALVPKTSSRRRNGVAGAITIGREFFVTALKDYENWREKWWREAIQNSFDAGSSEIELGAVQNDDGTWTVWCQDDGGGMDEDVLINKFLVLGGSTKKDAEGKAGGFGKAKELLLLPWLKWVVHSRSLVVSGAGATYESSPGPHIGGTRVEVLMPADQYTYSAPAESFLSKCSLSGVKFSIVSGTSKATETKQIRANFRPGKQIEAFPNRADVFYNKGVQGDARLLIRTKGLLMYDRYLWGETKGWVTVELTGKSTDLLTANRDGLRDYELRRSLDDLAAKIAVDPKSTVERSRSTRKIWQGSGKFKAEKRQAEAVAQVADLVDTAVMADGGKIEIDAGALETMGKVFEDYRKESDRAAGAFGSNLPSGGVVVQMMGNIQLRGQNHLQAALKQLAWDPDFLIENEVEDYRVPKRFTPEGMTPRILKLAKVWTELCRFVFLQLGDASPFGVGWIFSDSALAACLPHGGSSWLMLNPFVDISDRDEILSPSNDEHLKRIYASAIHEATHITNGIDSHNESFAAALTHNIGLCADGWRHIKRIVAAIRQHGPVEAGTTSLATGGKKKAPKKSAEKPATVNFLSRLDPDGVPFLWIARVTPARPGEDHGISNGSILLGAKSVEDIPARIKERVSRLDGVPGSLALLAAPGWINGDPPFVQDEGWEKELLWME